MSLKVVVIVVVLLVHIRDRLLQMAHLVLNDSKLQMAHLVLNDSKLQMAHLVQYYLVTNKLLTALNRA